MTDLDEIIDRHAVPGSLCSGCNREVDPETCWCGGAIAAHTVGDGHSPVSIGCVCHYGRALIKHDVEIGESWTRYDANWDPLP